MGLFSKTIEAPAFGKLHSSGQSKVWEATLQLAELGEFLVRVHGSKTGPKPEQCTAWAQLLTNAAQIRADATPRILEFLREAQALPEDISLNADLLWQQMTPEFVEVHAGNEYAMGKGAEGEIAISIGYALPLFESGLLQIAVLAGKVDAVYSE